MYKVFYINFTGRVDYKEFYRRYTLEENENILYLSTEKEGSLRVDKERNILIEENDNELGSVLAIADGDFKEFTIEEYNLLINFKTLKTDSGGYGWYVHTIKKSNEIINGKECFVLTFIENETGDWYSDENIRIGYISIQEIIREKIENPATRDTQGHINRTDYVTVVEKEVINNAEEGYTEHLDIAIDLAFTKEKWELPFSTGEAIFCTIDAYVEQILDEEKYNQNRMFSFNVFGSEMLPYRHFENAGIINEVEQIIQYVSQITGRKYTFHIGGNPIKTISPVYITAK